MKKKTLEKKKRGEKGLLRLLVVRDWAQNMAVFLFCCTPGETL